MFKPIFLALALMAVTVGCNTTGIQRVYVPVVVSQEQAQYSLQAQEQSNRHVENLIMLGNESKREENRHDEANGWLKSNTVSNLGYQAQGAVSNLANAIRQGQNSNQNPTFQPVCPNGQVGQRAVRVIKVLRGRN